MKRLCFGWHLDSTRHAMTAPLPLASGLPPSNAMRVGDLRRAFDLTSNKGFMVIGEATARLFVCDPEASTILDLRRYAALAQSPAELAAQLNRSFDALVLGLAYEINPASEYSRLVALLEEVRIPIISLDLSVADAELAADQMHESVMRLVRLLSERAALFGVRAFSTQQWLERNGIGRGAPVGCPSMYLYPHSLLELAAPSRSPREAMFATGGYLFQEAQRARGLGRLFADARANYIVQDEVFSLDDAQLARLRYIDARREFSAQDVNDLAERDFGYRPPFQRYFVFDDMHSWRQNLAWHDAYVGDRYHGAVTAMQAGLPTVVICKDVRSQEIAAYYASPALSLEQALDLGLAGLVEKMLARDKLDAMKSMYLRRFAEFRGEIEKCGLRLNLMP